MTRRRSNNQWSGSIVAHPTPKNSECKNPLEKFSPRFLESRRHRPHWLSSKGANYQSRILLISAGATEGHFEGKMPWEGHQGGLVLHDNAPANRALATQKKLAFLGFQCLDHPPHFLDLALALSDYHLFPGLKKQLKGRHFSSDAEVCCHRDLVGRTTFWIFFEWLAKVRATSYEVYWASWGVRWINSEFGRCSWAKDLSASPLILNLQVQGIDKYVVDVIRAIIAFKSTLVLQKLHLYNK